MMKYTVLVVVALLNFPSPAKAANIVLQAIDTEFEREKCDMVVDFSSYASGVDLGTRKAIEDYVQKDKSVYFIKSYPWGREGESSLCLKVRKGKTKELFEVLKSMIPEDARAPTTVDDIINKQSHSNSYR